MVPALFQPLCTSLHVQWQTGRLAAELVSTFRCYLIETPINHKMNWWLTIVDMLSTIVRAVSGWISVTICYYLLSRRHIAGDSEETQKQEDIYKLSGILDIMNSVSWEWGGNNSLQQITNRQWTESVCSSSQEMASIMNNKLKKSIRKVFQGDMMCLWMCHSNCRAINQSHCVVSLCERCGHSVPHYSELRNGWKRWASAWWDWPCKSRNKQRQANDIFQMAFFVTITKQQWQKAEVGPIKTQIQH